MSLLCAFGGHRPGPGQVYNSGYYFSACARCGRALVRSARSDWQTAPPGHRIVWKAGRHSHSVEADYADFLPVALRESTLPAVPGPFASWSRALVQVRAPVRRAARVAATAEESGELRCPRLVLMAVMIGAGLKLLLSFGTSR